MTASHRPVALPFRRGGTALPPAGVAFLLTMCVAVVVLLAVVHAAAYAPAHALAHGPFAPGGSGVQVDLRGGSAGAG